MELFKLFGSILIDDQKAIDALNKTDKKASSVTGTLGKLAGGAAKIGTAIVSAGAVATTALIGIATTASAAGDRVDKMSQRLGLSREGFQEWDYVLSQAGVSIDSMQTGMKQLTKTMTDESDKNADRLAKLGLAFNDIQNMSQEDAFGEIIKGFQGLEEGAEKARLAQDLFGKQGQELLPLLNSQAGGIEELKKKAHELGMVMSDSAVDGAVAMTDGMDTIKRSVGGLFNTLGAKLMPVIQQVMDVIIANMPMIQSIIERLTPIIGKVFEQLLPPLMGLVEKLLPIVFDLIEQLFPVLGELMEGIMPVIISLLDMLLPPIIEIVKMLLPLLLDIIKPLLPLLVPLLAVLQPFIDLLMMIIEPLVELLNMVLPPLATMLAKFFEWYLPKLTAGFKFVADIIGGAVKSAFNGLKPVIDNIKNVFNGIIDFVKNVFSGNWRGAWNNIISIFKNIFDGIKNYIKLPVNIIIDALNAFFKGVSKIKIPDWVPVIGGKGFTIPTIPRLKVGMDYVPYDEFPALLHKGERVLTAEENRNMKTGADSPINIHIGTFVNNTKDDLKKLTEEIYFLIRQEKLKQGGF